MEPLGFENRIPKISGLVIIVDSKTGYHPCFKSRFSSWLDQKINAEIDQLKVPSAYWHQESKGYKQQESLEYWQQLVVLKILFPPWVELRVSGLLILPWFLSIEVAMDIGSFAGPTVFDACPNESNRVCHKNQNPKHQMPPLLIHCHRRDFVVPRFG